jgi:hypothetical protein
MVIQKTFYVAGHFNYQGACSKLRNGDLVYLVPEPDNEYDENAIKLLTKDGLDIGYVPASKNKGFFKLLENTHPNYCARVKEVKGGGQYEYLPQIEVFFAKEESELPFTQQSKYKLNTTYNSDGTVTQDVDLGIADSKSNTPWIIATLFLISVLYLIFSK